MVAIDPSIKKLVDAEKGTMSPRIFSDPDLYEQELDQIFDRSWLFVGHESQIPNPGDFILSRMGQENVILTRDRQGKIHVALNACRHRGNLVCRYDSGHAFAFQCTFHGWVYDSSGALVTLPKVDGAYDEMPKEEWGLLPARVEVFQGTIWATWDKTAPSFIDYLGGSERYLEIPFLGFDGSDNGAEVLGGVMKWRIGMNWKVPMPDNDSTHGWITHRSMALAMGVSPSGSRVSVVGDPSDLGGRGRGRARSMQVAFPEGHTSAVRVPRENEEDHGWNDNGQYDDYPIIKEYLRDRWEALASASTTAK